MLPIIFGRFNYFQQHRPGAITLNRTVPPISPKKVSEFQRALPLFLAFSCPFFMPEGVPPCPTWSSGDLPSVVDLTSAPSCQGACTLEHHHVNPSDPSQPRPVSLLPQIPAYRHSYHPSSRKPIRSSPLAGPAIQPDSVIVEAEEEKPRPSRISSSPDLKSTPPLPLKLARPRTAGSPRGFHPLFASPPYAENRRGTTLSISPLENITQAANKESVSLTTPPSSLSGRPRWSLRHSPSVADDLRKEESFASLDSRRPKTAHGYPAPPKRNSLRDPGDNSWFAFDPYSGTPKFTRLSLASSGVVLPLSAKEHKREHRNSRSSLVAPKTSLDRASTILLSPTNSLPSPSPQQGTFSLPSPGLASYNSSTSSFDSFSSLPPRGSTAATSQIATIAEEDNDHQRESPSKSNNQGHHRSNTASIPKTGPLARIKRFGLRSIRSLNHLRSQSSTTAVSTSAGDEPPVPKLGFCVPTLGTTSVPAPTETKRGVPLPVFSLRSKRASVKQFWKSMVAS